ncbi:unnamed protein product [Cyprideis torosa]|uniref:Uncharacterized protein n=1 Tax=Cyprideis torosa TaxID=163714 RepID=A0A7R8W6U9_9CRUS|nr:unnamed protein product [Cyprideis torosa]CAG0882668.1 unnamed protein product [Cyprideis torosa]
MADTTPFASLVYEPSGSSVKEQTAAVSHYLPDSMVPFVESDIEELLQSSKQMEGMKVRVIGQLKKEDSESVMGNWNLMWKKDKILLENVDDCVHYPPAFVIREHVLVQVFGTVMLSLEKNSFYLDCFLIRMYNGVNFEERKKLLQEMKELQLISSNIDSNNRL